MSNRTLNFIKMLLFPRTTLKGGFGFAILAMLVLVDVLVDLTGGTYLAYLHFMYFPIIFAGFAFSVTGGILTGVLAGILLGPVMLIDPDPSHTQPMASWLSRLGIFALVGAFAGLGSSMFRAYLRELEAKHTTNSITGLPNLNGLKNIFNAFIHQSLKPLPVIVIDLFQMSRIDRAMGTEGTESLIRQVADNLHKELGDLCTVGHLHSKRFTLLLPDDKDLDTVLEKCNTVASKSYAIDDIPIFIEMHFGIANYPEDAQDLASLTRKGHLAIDVAKRNSQRFGFFEADAVANPERNLLLLHQLSKAIENRTLELHYQPQVNLKTGDITGLEALARWTDPILGSVPPLDFIPLAEGTTLINPFTKWLVEEAIKKARELHDAGFKLQISINFSMKNFFDSSVLETLQQKLKEYKVDCNYFELEVTETAVATNIRSIARTLNNLRQKGHRIAVDDFGTGQSSQHYLFELPIDVIKIDKLFVSEITRNKAAAAIVHSCITLGHELGLEIVAEGVETEEQLALLKRWGCDIVQGYILSRSLPSGDVIEWLTAHRRLQKKTTVSDEAHNKGPF